MSPLICPNQLLRNFLLFLPATDSTPPLKAVLSYYQSAVSVNAEGDTLIREDTLEGLGTKSYFLKLLFGAVFSIAEPQRGRTSQLQIKEAPSPTASHDETADMANIQALNSVRAVGEAHARSVEANHPLETIKNALRGRSRQEPTHEAPQKLAPSERSRLTEILPDPGYFAAGAIAGVVSRTATAPIDRLKVYLIANVSPKSAPLETAKQGKAVAAAKMSGQPFVLAIRELWKAGGIHSLFAGTFLLIPTPATN